MNVRKDGSRPEIDLPECACRTAESRFQRRLHAVTAVRRGLTTSKVAEIFGVSQRTVQSWLMRARTAGPGALRDRPRSGRPPRLSCEQRQAVNTMIRSPPKACSLRAEAWTGEALSEYIFRECGVRLCARQCERYIASERKRRDRPRSQKPLK